MNSSNFVVYRQDRGLNPFGRLAITGHTKLASFKTLEDGIAFLAAINSPTTLYSVIEEDVAAHWEKRAVAQRLPGVNSKVTLIPNTKETGSV